MLAAVLAQKRGQRSNDLDIESAMVARSWSMRALFMCRKASTMFQNVGRHSNVPLIVADNSLQ